MTLQSGAEQKREEGGKGERKGDIGMRNAGRPGAGVMIISLFLFASLSLPSRSPVVSAAFPFCLLAWPVEGNAGNAIHFNFAFFSLSPPLNLSPSSVTWGFSSPPQTHREKAVSRQAGRKRKRERHTHKRCKKKDTANEETAETHTGANDTGNG